MDTALLGWAFSGVLIGTVMGLTGAGGALVAIPLFMEVLGMSLKEASSLSLGAVVIASGSNLYYQRKDADFRLGLLIVLCSAIASYVSTSWKALLPDAALAALLLAVTLYATVNIWRRPSASADSHGEKATHAAPRHLLLSIGVGLGLGVLTTLTGLGGGVLMVPVLQGLYHFPLSAAVATSLFAVSLSSLVSLGLQFAKNMTPPPQVGWLYLVLGIVLSAFLLARGTRFIPSGYVSWIRKVVFTGVALMAALSLLRG